jgi:hypothetical protein
MTFAEFVKNKKAESSAAEWQDSDVRVKSKPIVESAVEFDYEMYKSNWTDLSETGDLDHILEDLKGGNIKKGAQLEEINHWIQFCTKCRVWHHNPKNFLKRSFYLGVSEASGRLNLTMSIDATFFNGIRTYKEKRHEKRESVPQRSLMPFKKKEDTEQW